MGEEWARRWKREATRYRKQARYWNERHWTLLQKHHDERTDARQEVLTAHQERDRAVASVAALLHAYIGITPGTMVDGLTPEVQAEAERLLEERLALEAERDDLRDECQALRAALASVGVRDA